MFFFIQNFILKCENSMSEFYLDDLNDIYQFVRKNKDSDLPSKFIERVIFQCFKDEEIINFFHELKKLIENNNDYIKKIILEFLINIRKYTSQEQDLYDNDTSPLIDYGIKIILRDSKIFRNLLTPIIDNSKNVAVINVFQNEEINEEIGFFINDSIKKLVKKISEYVENIQSDPINICMNNNDMYNLSKIICSIEKEEEIRKIGDFLIDYNNKYSITNQDEFNSLFVYINIFKSKNQSLNQQIDNNINELLKYVKNNNVGIYLKSAKDRGVSNDEKDKKTKDIVLVDEGVLIVKNLVNSNIVMKLLNKPLKLKKNKKKDKKTITVNNCSQYNYIFYGIFVFCLSGLGFVSYTINKENNNLKTKNKKIVI